MKEGLTYIAKRTKQLRYAAESYTKEDGPDGIIPNNPEEQWLQPISVYYAFDTPILRGDPVSIRAVIPNEGLAEDPYPYVEKTDSSKHTKCIGIALEYAGPGEAVHVQPFGKVVFDDTKNPSGDREHHFSNDTPVKLLLRYACQSKELYDVMIKTYQKELTSLLEGRFLSEIENKGKYFQRAYLESHEFGFRAESNKK